MGRRQPNFYYYFKSLEQEVANYVELFDDLLSRKVTLESLLQLTERADYYGNVSAVGALVIAQSARGDTSKRDPLLKKLRDRIHPLWDSYGRARRNASRSKRDTASEIRALKKELHWQFGDMSEQQRHNSEEHMATSAWLTYHQDVKRPLSHADIRLSALSDPRLVAPPEHEFESVRRSCASMGSDPIDLLVNIQVMLVGWCPFDYCFLYHLISFERFTLRSLNRFATILHEDFVRIMMHKSVCIELVDGELGRDEGRIPPKIQWPARGNHSEAIKEGYWPRQALRLAKKVVGDKDIPIPKADEVEKVYRPIAERIKANLSANYPWYSYEVIVYYPHELADDHAIWEAKNVAHTRCPHRNVNVAIFRRKGASSMQLSLDEFSDKKTHIAQLFKSGGTKMSSGLRELQDTMPKLIGDIGFSNAFAMRCHRSNAPAAWSTSPFSFNVDNYSGMLLFRRCAFTSFFLY